MVAVPAVDFRDADMLDAREVISDFFFAWWEAVRDHQLATHPLLPCSSKCRVEEMGMLDEFASILMTHMVGMWSGDVLPVEVMEALPLLLASSSLHDQIFLADLSLRDAEYRRSLSYEQRRRQSAYLRMSYGVREQIAYALVSSTPMAACIRFRPFFRRLASANSERMTRRRCNKLYDDFCSGGVMGQQAFIAYVEQQWNIMVPEFVSDEEFQYFLHIGRLFFNDARQRVPKRPQRRNRTRKGKESNDGRGYGQSQAYHRNSVSRAT